jgi:type I restriction enzyme S subunit
MKSNYKRIGAYIRPLNVKNTDLRAKELLGINIDKFFMPSVANVVGTDLSKYKVVEKNQFACNRMHVGRDYRIPISCSDKNEPFMVSPAYDVFEIKDTKVLIPEFLMMWFSRKEFDRNAWFYTDADVRGGLPWKSFCEMQLPIPHPDKQREIVKEYNTIQNRINLNNQLIQKLEETAQAIYKQWFVEGIDLENLPEGWRKSKIGDEVETLGGGTPSTEIEEYWNDGDIMWYSPTDITNNNSVFIFQSANRITKAGLSKSSAKIFPANSLMMTSRATVGKLAINTAEATTNQGFITLVPTSELNVFYLYCWINTQIEEIINLASGSTFLEISKSDFRNLDVVIPENEINIKFKRTINPFFENIKLKTRENQKLTELKELLLSKLATVNN